MTPGAKKTVLVVEDDPMERAVLAEMVASLGYAVEQACDGEEALEKLDTTPVAAIVTDLMMPRMDGFELLRGLIDAGQTPPAIVLTAFGNIAQAVSIVHELRAFWFLEKPADRSVLGTLLERALEYGSLVRETERLQRELGYHGILGDLVGASKPMQQVSTLIQRVAPTTASVLITGESGTGKEMVARTIHRLSPRAARPFVAINCAAVPQDLIESELFGHEKGAFTGAVGRRAGCFEQADGGTLLLDEIGEMPLAMQARLLRALEESKVRRLGGTSETAVNVRVLAATNRLVSALDRKTLREDLYYRLNVFNIHMPPLRERKDDIALLAQAILGDLNRKHETNVTNLHAGALERLMSHSWPGNVRELRNVLEWSVITVGKGTIHPWHLPKSFGAAVDAPQAEERSVPRPEGGKTLDEVEMEYIMYTLQVANNDRKKAAHMLGISVRTLYNRLARPAVGEKKSAQTAGSEVA
ncbi:MAG TPA: sigma-54 dependent transcriptional regulator [Bryobacteraceae bacterium]|nr:sigma-54 dependent transcriptional regulator [Bryobacteraceae bacterium]